MFACTKEQTASSKSKTLSSYWGLEKLKTIYLNGFFVVFLILQDVNQFNRNTRSAIVPNQPTVVFSIEKNNRSEQKWG